MIKYSKILGVLLSSIFHSHPIKYLLMPTSKTLLGLCAEVDSQLSHTSKIAIFAKLENGLNSIIYAKISTLDA